MHAQHGCGGLLVHLHKEEQEAWRGYGDNIGALSNFTDGAARGLSTCALHQAPHHRVPPLTRA